MATNRGRPSPVVRQPADLPGHESGLLEMLSSFGEAPVSPRASRPSLSRPSLADSLRPLTVEPLPPASDDHKKQASAELRGPDVARRPSALQASQRAKEEPLPPQPPEPRRRPKPAKVGAAQRWKKAVGALGRKGKQARRASRDSMLSSDEEPMLTPTTSVVPGSAAAARRASQASRRASVSSRRASLKQRQVTQDAPPVEELASFADSIGLPQRFFDDEVVAQEKEKAQQAPAPVARDPNRKAPNRWGMLRGLAHFMGQRQQFSVSPSELADVLGGLDEIRKTEGKTTKLTYSSAFAGFLNTVSPDFVLKLKRHADVIETQGTTQEVLMTQGSASQMVFLVMSGRVEIEERLGPDDEGKRGLLGQRHTRTVTQGSLFGEEVVIGCSETQVGTARTFGKCLIWRIAGQKLMDTLKEVTQDSRLFVRTIADGMHGEVRDVVSQLTFLHKGSEDLVDQLASAFETSVYLKGQTIFAQDAPGDSLSLVMHGHVRVEANDTAVGELVADGCTVHVLGERHLLGISPVRCCALRAKMLTVVRTLRSDVCRGVLGGALEELKQAKLAQLGDSLAEAHAFNSAPPQFLSLLAVDYERRLVVPGSLVCQEGEPAECMFFLARGTAVVERRGGVPQEITEGVCFDELAALGCVNARDATVVAAKVATVQVLHRARVLSALEEYPEQAERFWCSLRWNKKQGMEKKALHALGQNRFLRNVEDPEFLAVLAQRCDLHFYFPEQRIIRQNDKEDRSMFFVQHGTAVLEVDGTVQGKVQAGDSFGEFTAMSMTVMRAATIRAKSVCACWVLSSEALHETLADFPTELGRFELLAMNNILSDMSAFQRVLGEFNFFAGCSAEFLGIMAKSIEGRRFEAGQSIVCEGDTGESVFFLHRGRAVALVGGVQVGELNDRSCFGEMAVLGVSKDRTATIRTTTSSIVWELSREILLAALQRFPREELRFKELAQMRSKVNKQLLDDDAAQHAPPERSPGRPGPRATVGGRARIQSMAHLQASMMGTLQCENRAWQPGLQAMDSTSESSEEAAQQEPKPKVVIGAPGGVPEQVEAKKHRGTILDGLASGAWKPRVKKRQSAVCMGLLGWQENATGLMRTFRAWRKLVRAERKERMLQKRRDKEIAQWLERKSEQRNLARECNDYRFAMSFSTVPRDLLYDDQVKVLDLGPGLDGQSQSLLSSALPSQWSSMASQSRCQHRVDSCVQVYRPQPQGLRNRHRRRPDVLTPLALHKLHATRPRLGRIAAALEREELWDDWQDG